MFGNTLDRFLSTRKRVRFSVKSGDEVSQSAIFMSSIRDWRKTKATANQHYGAILDRVKNRGLAAMNLHTCK